MTLIYDNEIWTMTDKSPTESQITLLRYVKVYFLLSTMRNEDRGEKRQIYNLNVKFNYV